jgi:broad specificity phosphatase PhoE
MTAKLLALPNPIMENDLVRERDWAALDRLPVNERATAFDGHIERRPIDPYHWTPPGGESIADVVARVRIFLDELQGIEGARGRVVVVCHGETIKAFRALLENISPNEYREIFLEGGVRDKIYNCHALIYRRQEDEPHFSSARSVCTYDPKRLDSRWYKLNAVRSA